MIDNFHWDSSYSEVSMEQAIVKYFTDLKENK